MKHAKCSKKFNSDTMCTDVKEVKCKVCKKLYRTRFTVVCNDCTKKGFCPICGKE